MIGGFGADNLVGDAGDDILIGGYTSYDNNETALREILGRWEGNGSYQAREAALQSANFQYRLIADQSVFDDNAVDELTGSAGSDWFSNVEGKRQAHGPRWHRDRHGHRSTSMIVWWAMMHSVV